MAAYLDRSTRNIFSKIQKNDNKINILLKEFEERLKFTKFSNNNILKDEMILAPSEYNKNMIVLISTFFNDYMQFIKFLENVDLLKDIPKFRFEKQDIG